MLICICAGCYARGMNSISIYIYTFVAIFQAEEKILLCYSVIFQLSLCLLLMFPDEVKNSEIEMKPNQAYETVSLPTPSRSTTQVHTEPCPAYEVVVQAHH